MYRRPRIVRYLAGCADHKCCVNVRSTMSCAMIICEDELQYTMQATGLRLYHCMPNLFEGQRKTPSGTHHGCGICAFHPHCLFSVHINTDRPHGRQPMNKTGAPIIEPHAIRKLTDFAACVDSIDLVRRKLGMLYPVYSMSPTLAIHYSSSLGSLKSRPQLEFDTRYRRSHQSEC